MELEVRTYKHWKDVIFLREIVNSHRLFVFPVFLTQIFNKNKIRKNSKKCLQVVFDKKWILTICACSKGLLIAELN